MARKKKKRVGYGKLLDAWVPPPDAGEAIGCVATTFTFSPVFFEEACLGRFLQLQTDPNQDGPLYLIDREEKLAQVSCAAALVDQHYCRGVRSLRWDLLSARIPGGILHAKVAVLHWRRCVRLIITSANLTEDGYRRNQEIFGVLDYRPDGEAPRPVLKKVVEFLRGAAAFSEVGNASSPALSRWNHFLDGVLSVPTDWCAETGRRRPTIRVEAILCGPRRPDALNQLTRIWPAASPPYLASVVSPFFDPPGPPNRPARELWNHLRQRGKADVEFYVTADDIPGENTVFVHAPRSLNLAEPSGRSGVSTTFHRVELQVDSEPRRPLHAKSIWFEDDRWIVYMIGSSNFTSAGLGIGGNANVEANLAFVVDTHRSEKADKRFGECHLSGDPIDLDAAKWQPRDDDEEDSPGETVLLPKAFSTAVYEKKARQEATLTLAFSGKPPPGWIVRLDEDDAPFFSEVQRQQSKCPSKCCLTWNRHRPPSGLWVAWHGANGSVWWPVNVKTPASLPPPQKLKDLSLAVLIDILTSARPLTDVIRKRTPPPNNGGPPPRPPPVYTSQFLLQRTRRVAGAFNALRQRLERPAITAEALDWRLRGPVGVIAMADALAREAVSTGETAFLLSELALELSRVRPQHARGCVPVPQVRREVHKLIGELKTRIPNKRGEMAANLRNYLDEVFERLPA